MMRLDSGESGQLVTPLTTQTLTYLQGAGYDESLSAPNYETVAGSPGAPHNAHVGNTDNITLAVAELAYYYTDRTGDTFSGAMTLGAGSSLTVDNTIVVDFNMAIGTSPFTVISTTVVTNLNANLLDGVSESAFSLIDGTRPFSGIVSYSPARAAGAFTGDQMLVNKAYADSIAGGGAIAEITNYTGSSASITPAGGGTFGDDSRFSWLMSRNGTVNGRCYFLATDGNWILSMRVSGTIRIMDDNTGAATYTVTGVVSVGGGEYYHQLLGDPDIRGYTILQTARFIHQHYTVLTAVRGADYCPPLNNTARFRIYADSIDSEANPGDFLYLYVDALTANEIVIASICGINQFLASFDADNGIYVGGASLVAPSRWQIPVTIRAGGDRMIYDVEVVVIPVNIV